MSYVHRVRVRYGECDMQRVVFNANYLAYIDDATDTWFRETLGLPVRNCVRLTQIEPRAVSRTAVRFAVLKANRSFTAH